MDKYIRVDENQRIASFTDTGQDFSELQEDGFLFEFPKDFDFTKIHDYKIVDGQLVHAPMHTARLAEIAAELALLDEESRWPLTNTLLGISSEAEKEVLKRASGHRATLLAEKARLEAEANT